MAAAVGIRQFHVRRSGIKSNVSSEIANTAPCIGHASFLTLIFYKVVLYSDAFKVGWDLNLMIALLQIFYRKKIKLVNQYLMKISYGHEYIVSPFLTHGVV